MWFQMTRLHDTVVLLFVDLSAVCCDSHRPLQFSVFEQLAP